MPPHDQCRPRLLQPWWLAGRLFCLDRARRVPTPAKSIFTAALLTLGGLLSTEVRGEVSKEYDLKAVLLYHLTQFVEWPPASFSKPDAPFVIGILGHDPFGKVLEDLVRQETQDQRKIVVEHYHGLDAVGKCQILFVDASESRNLPRILSALRGRPVLTVGEFDEFALHGGMIRFIKNPDDRIMLRINLDAARSSGLNISARLLRVAEVVPAVRN